MDLLPDRPTFWDLVSYIRHHVPRVRPARAACKQALWHCLVENGAASGVTYATERLDWVQIDRPDVDGEAVGAVWHQIRMMFKSDWLSRVHKAAADRAMQQLTGFPATDAAQRSAAKMRGDLAVKTLLAGCPGSPFTRGIRP